MPTKLEVIIPLITGKEIDKTQQEWADFQTIKKIRKRLVHYAGGTEIYNNSESYGVNIANAEKGINMVRGLVKQLCAHLGANVPPWVNQTQSRTIH